MNDAGMNQSLDPLNTSGLDTSTKPVLTVVESAGSLLSAARQQKNWSVQQVAEQLKLSTKQVVALEANEFDALPQMVIVRGFIRAYAKLLKIDADTVVAFLPKNVSKEQLESALKPGLSTPFQESRLSLMGRQDSNSKYILGAGLLAVLAVGFFLLQKFEHADFVKNLLSPAPVLSESVPLARPEGLDHIIAPSLPNISSGAPIQVNPAVGVASSVDLEMLGGQKAVGQGVSNLSNKPLTENSTGISVKINDFGVILPTNASNNDVMKLKFRQDTWIQIKKVNGNIVTSHLAKAGTEEIFNVKESLQVKIGNAAGVEGVLRGAPLEILAGKDSNVVNLNVK
ncbi:MAG: DUF4115 domain-containing protein [Undibacterium sp.]|uniref:helix-turn-helix domain-containing protein n=1 Tax=Undibacterium sp. TaxID=1914977 RepID=UPI00271DB44C|nr:RodZ domain-containing protein [Undibacterium sp.]MDO8653648.1 DUF4115 domain-containing protein [Undibacterium sp.]